MNMLIAQSNCFAGGADVVVDAAMTLQNDECLVLNTSCAVSCGNKSIEMRKSGEGKPSVIDPCVNKIENGLTKN